jgi:omega-6 fatty acid desaturase (delta-12 desaturase)
MPHISLASAPPPTGSTGNVEHASSVAATPGTDEAEDQASWRATLAPYATPSLRLSLQNVATSVVPYVALIVAMFFALRVSLVLMLLLAVPAAGFLVRTFIVFHDCAHGSFLPSKRANAYLGAVLGLLLFTPYAKWRHAHARHHATAGDLDRRGVGDVKTMTVAEYRAEPLAGRLAYRAFRNPLVMLILGPTYAMVIQPRFVGGGERARLRRSVLATDAALLVLVGGLCWLIGWQAYLLIQGPVMLLAGGAGVWLFYVQHQFEDTYWQSGESWSYADAALRGSSYLKLPPLLQFFTGNIGLHHVHHLSARVPNYHLQRAHDENPIFHDVPVLTLWQGMRAFRLKLWDPDRGRLVGFEVARARRSL